MNRRTVIAMVSALWLASCVHLPNTAHTESAAGQAGGPITNSTPLAAVIKEQQVHPLDPTAGIPLLDQAMIELAKTDPENRYRGITYNLIGWCKRRTPGAVPPRLLHPSRSIARASAIRIFTCRSAVAIRIVGYRAPSAAT
jgi:hypothetical protein